MRPMPSVQEKAAFAQRLRLALNRSAKPIKGATDLARLFNLKHPGSMGVSVQTAHKWLTGRTMPTTSKITTLAVWLGVSEHWLHYGPPPETDLAHARTASDRAYKPVLETLTLVRRIEALPETQRYLVEELVAQFYGKLPK